MMKVLSLNPPHGTLIAACERFPDLGKHIETRGRWHYRYRGPLLIHQTVGLGEMFDSEEELRAFCAQEPFRSTLAVMGYRDASELPRGAIVARVELVGAVRTEALTRYGPTTWDGPDGRRYRYEVSERERTFGNYALGRRALLLADIKELREPIPARGMPGLWDWTPPEGISL